MPGDEHEFFPQPHGSPPWCFCQAQACPGWAAYLAWYRDGAEDGGDPPPEVIAEHRRITTVLADLTRHYSEVLGSPVDPNTALDLALVDIAADDEDRLAVAPQIPAGPIRWQLPSLAAATASRRLRRERAVYDTGGRCGSASPGAEDGVTGSRSAGTSSRISRHPRTGT